MFLTISNPEEYTDNRFGDIIVKLMGSSDDLICKYENYLFAIRRYSNASYELSFCEIIREDSDQSFKVKIIDENIEVDTYKNIGYKIMRSIRDIIPSLKDKRFPVEKLQFKPIYDASHAIYTED